MKHNIKVIVIASSRDFGRCPLATRLPMTLWPILDRSVLQSLLEQLASQKIVNRVTVCSSGDAELLQKYTSSCHALKLDFINDHLPLGPAGCIRDAADEEDDFLIILSAQILLIPPIEDLIQTHMQRNADLTVFLQPVKSNSLDDLSFSEIYVCQPSVLKYVPEKGFCDIKESLIPTMLKAKADVCTALLSQPTFRFWDRHSYIAAVADYLEFENIQPCRISDKAKIDGTSRLYGPVTVMDGAIINANAVIFGPAVIGRNVSIGYNTLIENSFLWDNSTVADNCCLAGCVVDYNTVVPRRTFIQNQTIVCKNEPSVASASQIAYSNIVAFINKYREITADAVKSGILGKIILRAVTISIFVLAFIWSYWPEIKNLINIWSGNDEYSIGLIVPLIALFVLWKKRNILADCKIKYSFWGLFFFVAAQALRHFGLFFMYASAQRLSLLISLASMLLFLFGWQIFRKLLPLFFFLSLMFPFPHSIHNLIVLPLQSWATASSVFLLEMFGCFVVRDGNIIRINGASLEVAQACSGLRLITAFFVISSLVVFLTQRPLWQKLVVLASSLPIALFCNTVRLTVTAILIPFLVRYSWEKTFHDFGGYAMMILALTAIVFELWLFSKLTFVSQPEQVEYSIKNKSDKHLSFVGSIK